MAINRDSPHFKAVAAVTLSRAFMGRGLSLFIAEGGAA